MSRYGRYEPIEDLITPESPVLADTPGASNHNTPPLTDPIFPASSYHAPTSTDPGVVGAAAVASIAAYINGGGGSRTHRRNSSLVNSTSFPTDGFDPSVGAVVRQSGTLLRHSGTRFSTDAAVVDEENELDDAIAFNLDDEDPFTQTTATVVPRATQAQSTSILLRKVLINSLFILLWYFFSLSISLYNKWMFSPAHLGFKFPLFATSIHMITQTCLAGSVLFFFPSLRPKPAARMTWKKYITHVGVCGIATGTDIGLGNMALEFVTLAFYTMVKSSNLIFVLLFAFLFRLEKPTVKLILVIAVMTIGVVMMVASETEFVVFGFFLVLTAAVLSGFRWSLTQMLLKHNEATTNPFAVIFYLAPVMCVTLFVLAVPIEGVGNFIHAPVWKKEPLALWFMILIAPGVIAFMMTASEFYLLHRTNVVTLSIVGIFKEVMTIIAAAGVYGDRLTVVNISGLFVTLFAIGVYNAMRINQMQKKIQDEQEATGASDGALPAGSGTQRGEYTAVPAGDASGVSEDLEMQLLPSKYDDVDVDSVVMKKV
ncbi:triose-phosphate transporter family-domain-containing protein [Limtongia smithiae]|uniref:triose-phosphate transporter family-domain-containing protein n=1 Tax=Limtongia smithiae TaxID=1125753 RepID=UPI0034CF1F67